MTLKEFELRCNDLDKEIIKYLHEERERLFSCGGIETEPFLNNFSLPTLITHVALKNFTNQLRPLYKTYQKMAKNLEHF